MGACVLSCAAPLTSCGVAGAARCVDPRSDPSNCGACGATCATGWACLSGTCVSTCEGVGGSLCADRCTDLGSDGLNCGTCGLACPHGTTCQDGTCALSCPSGQQRCADQCVDTTRDALHCGQCGHRCPRNGSCLAGVCVALACEGEVGLPAPSDLLEGRPADVAVGDIDGDGRLDVVASALGQNSERPSYIQYYRNQGGRRFAGSSRYDAGCRVGDLALGDVGGDGRLDAIIRCDDSPDISVLAGVPGGGFAAPRRFVTGVSLTGGFGVHDVDGDGRSDVVLANYSFAVLHGAEGEVLGTPTVTSRGEFYLHRGSIAFADFDGDGLPELVTGDVPGRLTIYRSASGGPLLASGVAVGREVRAVATGDLDGDGHPDVAAVIDDGRDFGVVTLRNHGDGTLEPGVVRTMGLLPWALAVADLNGDHHLDLAVSNYGEVRRVDVFWNKGDGTFSEPTPFFEPGANDLATGDLDGDGRTDLVAASTAGLGTHLMWNEGGRLLEPTLFGGPMKPSEATLADVDGDQHLDAVALDSAGKVGLWRGSGAGALALSAILEVPGAHAVAAGDLDGDGRADVAVAAAAGEVQLYLSREERLVAGQVVSDVGQRGPLAVADVTGDGVLDLLAQGPAAMLLFPGNGDGTVGDPSTVDRLAWGAAAMAIADVDGDDLDDVVLATSQELRVVRSLGGGAFASPLFVGLGGETATALSVGELDGDGHLDVLLTFRYRDRLGVLHGRGDGTFGPMVTRETAPLLGDAAIVPLRGGGAPGSVVYTSVSSVNVVDLDTGASQRWLIRSGFNSRVLWGNVDGDLRPDLVTAGPDGLSVLGSRCLAGP